MKKIKKPMSGKGKLAMSLATAGMLTLGTLGTALADTSNQDAGQETGNQAAGQRRGVFGSVTAKGENTLTLTLRGGETLVLTVNEQTQFQVPGKVRSTFSDVGTGTRVAALVRRDADGLTALKVMPMQDQPQREHRVLTVVEVNGRTLTAQDAQGKQITVELNHEINPDLAGQLTTFIGEHSQQSNNRFKANAEVKIEQIVERLEAHTARLQDEAGAEADDAARIRKEHEATQLMDRLEANRQRHLDRLEQVIDKAPLDARYALKQAMIRFEAQQAEARARFEAQQEEARARFKEMYEARLRALENPQGMPPERPGVVRPRPDAVGTNLGPHALQGVVQAVDARAGKLTLMTVDGKVVTLEAGQGFDISLGDRIVPLWEVTAGAKVTIHYSQDRLAVDAVQVKNEEWTVLTGTLMSVEPAAGTVTVGTREGSVQTLKVGPSALPQARVAIKELGALLPGTQVVIKYRTSGGEVIELAFGRTEAVGPKPTPPVTQSTNLQAEQELAQKKLLQMEQEQARARFHEEQALAWRSFQEQQTMALKRFYDDQGQAQNKFLEEQKLALARFQEQTKDELALARFREDQKLALVRFQEEQALTLKRFLTEQEQAQARFLEEQKLALARFLGQ
ncbi:MAG TPA: hypothetical protein VI855_00490 [Dehalococcoidia bacterium]|nr:hypothetical protein [Dehalococcoidia bacterium]